MTASPYFHVGILVQRLDRDVIAHFEEVLNITFVEPVTQRCDDFVEKDRKSTLELRLTYSMDGPPYYELIEAQGDGLYGPDNAGLHHVGVWEPDCAARMQTLDQQDMSLEGALYRPDGAVVVAFYEPYGLHGLRLEIADEGLRESHEAWLEGGEFVR